MRPIRIAALVVAAAAVVAFAGVGRPDSAGGAAKPSGGITVNGTGTITSVPDEATFTVGVQTQGPTAHEALAANSEQMRRVIINLVDNAIEATDRHGTVTVETAHDPSNSLVRITIADDGPGIPADEREKLFLPYYSTKGRGSGLGLAIVRRIVAEHGGSIEVVSNEPRGTRFTIELPA